MLKLSHEQLQDLKYRLKGSLNQDCVVSGDGQHINLDFPVGFVGFDLIEAETITWRSFSNVDFVRFVQAAVPWSRDNNFRYWKASPVISAPLNGVLRGMGWSPFLCLDLTESIILDPWLEDHKDPFYDLLRPNMKEETLMKYKLLTDVDKLAIAKDRLRAAETEYYRISIDPLTLGVLVGPDQESVVESRLAELASTIENLQAVVASLET